MGWKKGENCAMAHESYLCSTRKQVQVLRLRIPHYLHEPVIPAI